MYTKFIFLTFSFQYIYKSFVICLFKIQTSPVENQIKRDSLSTLDADVLIRQSEAARLLSTTKRVNDNEERTNLLPKQDHS